MTRELIVVLLICAVPPSALMVLTAIGEHRRGRALPIAVVAGLFFPIAWAVWYLRDERPYRGTRHG